MKKLLLTTTFIASSLLAEVVTLLPYGGVVNYDSDAAKSIKDTSTLYGIHSTVGNFSYLLEFDYAKFQTKYKQDTSLGPIEDLNQDDITLAYGYYWTNFMLRGGVHYINTNDILLGNGIVGFASLGGYNYVGYDKYSYGVEGYYSNYKDGYDEGNSFVKKSINIVQFTPYFTAYNALSLNWGNSLTLKLNYQIAKDYIQDSYLSYDVSDTLYYKSLFLTLRGYGGEMRSGVKDSGFTVANTLDLMKDGYGTKLGYYFTPSAVLSLSYDLNNYQEIYHDVDGTSSVATLSFSYGF